MNRIWYISVAGWIIQDGNYEDFATGDRRRFAIEFYGPSLKSSRGTAHTKHISLDRYAVTASVLVRAERAWVIDLGIAAFSERLAHDLPTFVECVSGEVSLSIDPYFYMDYLHKEANLPPLVYSWRVVEIWRDLTPWIDGAYEGRPARIRDPKRAEWQRVERTNAWDDDEGHPLYVLACELLDEPPSRRP